VTLSRRLFGAVGAALILLAALAARGADDLDRPSPERHVYDLAGVLTNNEVADLEARARAIHQLGHPIVIYLHKKEATYEKTVRDARRLMDAWDVQSAPEAHDGLVLLFNLKPSDPAHGSYALVAGKALIESRLPQYELDRVAGAMRPLLGADHVRGAIAGALDRIAEDVRRGPPAAPRPSASQRFARQVAAGPLSPFNLAAILIAGIATWLTARGGSRGRPELRVSSAAEPPSALAPALAGALATGYVDDADVAATILDLAKRGALAIEPEGKRQARIRLIDASVARPGYERRLWEILKSRANDAGIIASKQMARLQTDWSEVRDGIRQDLLARGWLDPEAGKRRRPLFLRGVGLDLLAVVGVALLVMAKSPAALVGVAALFGAAAYAIIAAVRIPNRTAQGDEAAAPWLGYRRHIESAGRDPQLHLDLETAVPYALGFGVGQSIQKRLQAASRGGYLPSWMGPAPAGDSWDGGFYPVWIAFQSSTAPASSGSAGGAGASAGSGAAGGSY
jgi:uncharacterized membrane protein YgcG